MKEEFTNTTEIWRAQLLPAVHRNARPNPFYAVRLSTLFTLFDGVRRTPYGMGYFLPFGLRSFFRFIGDES
jgi:hypothetical protein